MYNTLTRRVLLGLGFTVPVLALATGCPLLNKAPTNPNPSPTPIVANFANQSTDAYTGEIMMDGMPYPGMTYLQIRNPGNSTTGTRYPALPGISTDANGFFEVLSSLAPTASGSSQIVWPATSGATASAQTSNYTDLYVTDPLANPMIGANAQTPGVKIEADWKLNPSPGVGATVTESSSPMFKFSNLMPQGSPVAATGSFQFQIVVQSLASSSISWSSSWDAFNANGLPASGWNGLQGSATDTPTGSPVSTGSARWQVKWRSVSDGSMAFGNSLWMPITLK